MLYINEVLEQTLAKQSKHVPWAVKCQEIQRSQDV